MVKILVVRLDRGQLGWDQKFNASTSRDWRRHRSKAAVVQNRLEHRSRLGRTWVAHRSHNAFYYLGATSSATSSKFSLPHLGRTTQMLGKGGAVNRDETNNENKVWRVAVVGT
ncbi:Uncharacterized protein Fot_25035 [Forsythia ovata]|uniref:Uncharacterized protein n=1 Tax=Forsythia ovata TaxID=205694 RepID=A0ABD1U7Y6_9LAMI